MPNNAPQIEEPEQRHRKKKRRKSFKIEYQYNDGQWRPYYTSYSTEKGRYQALAHLNDRSERARRAKTDNFTDIYYSRFKYREKHEYPNVAGTNNH